MPGMNKEYYDGDRCVLEDNAEPYVHGVPPSPGAGYAAPVDGELGNHENSGPNAPQKSFDN